ncbi:hypothetical protein CBR69_04130 [Bordetella hinzii]|nr:hypothetical protein CBR69_04130 [Bordetella hinzii]
MFSHIVVGVSDFDRALRFYEPLFAVLGVSRRFCEPGVPWAGWHSGEGARPFFVIARPFDGAVHVAGNGQMTAFLAESREQVRQAHAAALQAGGACEGAPGLRPQYHADYYGAYFRDPDGNKLCVACHRRPPCHEGGALSWWQPLRARPSRKPMLMKISRSTARRALLAMAACASIAGCGADNPPRQTSIDYRSPPPSAGQARDGGDFSGRRLTIQSGEGERLILPWFIQDTQDWINRN